MSSRFNIPTKSEFKNHSNANQVAPADGETGLHQTSMGRGRRTALDSLLLLGRRNLFLWPASSGIENHIIIPAQQNSPFEFTIKRFCSFSYSIVTSINS